METIPRGIFDPHFRYKRNKIHIEPTKHFSVITNLDFIANEIYRTAPDIIRWLQLHVTHCEVKVLQQGGKVGTQVSLKGSVTQSALEDILEEFIEKFVLCESCISPETYFNVKKNKIVYLHCRACGYNTKCKSGHFSEYVLKAHGTGENEALLNQQRKQQKHNAKIEKANAAAKNSAEKETSKQEN